MLGWTNVNRKYSRQHYKIKHTLAFLLIILTSHVHAQFFHLFLSGLPTRGMDFFMVKRIFVEITPTYAFEVDADVILLLCFQCSSRGSKWWRKEKPSTRKIVNLCGVRSWNCFYHFAIDMSSLDVAKGILKEMGKENSVSMEPKEMVDTFLMGLMDPNEYRVYLVEEKEM